MFLASKSKRRMDLFSCSDIIGEFDLRSTKYDNDDFNFNTKISLNELNLDDKLVLLLNN